MKIRNMSRISSIVLPLLVSLILHIGIIISGSVYVKSGGIPVIYCWPGLLKKKDLFIIKKNILFPEGVNFSLDKLRRHYFYSDFDEQLFLTSYKRNYLFADRSIYPGQSSGNYVIPVNEHIYLWKKPVVFKVDDEEITSYRLLVSSQGKVIFSYPRKLPVNSENSLYLQEYIREASVFLKGKLSWTKIEGVIQ